MYKYTYICIHILYINMHTLHGPGPSVQGGSAPIPAQPIPPPWPSTCGPGPHEAHILVCNNCLLSFQEPNFSSFAV